MKRIKARKLHTNLILFATILQCNIAQIVYVKSRLRIQVLILQ